MNRDRVLGLALAAATIAVLLSNRSLQQTGDSLSYALAIRSGQDLFHPHHLLFAPLVRSGYVLSSLALESVDAVLAGQLHNAAWAAVGVVCMGSIVLHQTRSRALALAAATTLLAAEGFLVFASQVEVYVPATGASLLLTRLLLGWPGRPSVSRVCLVVLSFALLIFYHQSNILFCVPLAAFFCWGGERGSIRLGAQVIAVTGAIVLGAYVAAFVSEYRSFSPAEFADFCLRYAVGNRPWGSLEHVGTAGVAALLEAQLQSLVLVPESWRTPGARLLGAALLGLCLWNAARILRSPRASRYRVFLLAWIAAYYAFFLWWQPGQREFFITTTPPLLLLFFATLDDVGDRFGRTPVRTVVGLVIAASSLGFVLPRHVRQSLSPLRSIEDSFYVAAMQLVAAEGEDCLLLGTRRVVLSARYHFEAPVERTLILGRAGAVERRPTADALSRCAIMPLNAGARAVRDEEDSAIEQLEYLQWLFRLESVPARGTLSAAALRRVGEGPGARSYLLQQGDARVEMTGMLELCRAVDELARDPLPGRLETWFRARRGELEAAGVDPAFLGPDDS